MSQQKLQELQQQVGLGREIGGACWMDGSSRSQEEGRWQAACLCIIFLISSIVASPSSPRPVPAVLHGACAHFTLASPPAVLLLQVALLNVAAAAKGIDLHFVLTTAAATQQQLAATAQQQLLAAAAASASKGLELQTILAAAAAAQQQVAAAAQQQLLAAAAAAAAPAAHSHAGGGSVGAAHPLVHSDATAAAVTAALTPPPAPAAAQEGSITLLPAGNTTGRARDA